MFICDECGKVTKTPGLCFCPYCGSEKGKKTDDKFVPEGYVPMMSPKGIMFTNQKRLRKIPIALLLGFIPGLMDVFGLGHLLIGKWFRGLLFLASSAAILYFRYFSEYQVDSMYILVASLLLFMVQLLDLYNCLKDYFNKSVI